MAKWLQDNPLGAGLAALCGLLLLVMLVLGVLASLPLSVPTPDTAGEASESGVELPTLASNQAFDSYSVIAARPLFNESRQPELDEVVENEEPPPEPDSGKQRPEVELAGVIITPSLRMVTLKRKDSPHSLVAFEGRPIEADFGNWHVSRVQPRAATLTSASGEELQLEMKVHDAKIEPPARPVEAEKPAENDTAGEDSEEEPLSRAEEIRQRIAERREELRREAEEAGQTEQEKPAAKPRPTSYQEAIQSLMQGNRDKKGANEGQK